jgi:hypothetical protein
MTYNREAPQSAKIMPSKLKDIEFLCPCNGLRRASRPKTIKTALSLTAIDFALRPCLMHKGSFTVKSTLKTGSV